MLTSLVGGYVVGWDHHKGVYREKKRHMKQPRIIRNILK